MIDRQRLITYGGVDDLESALKNYKQLLSDYPTRNTVLYKGREGVN